MDTAKLEFFRGTLDVLILKALIWVPLHGYAITNLIRRQSDDALLLEEGTLYPALWRLENKGLLMVRGGCDSAHRRREPLKPASGSRRRARQRVSSPWRRGRGRGCGRSGPTLSRTCATPSAHCSAIRKRACRVCIRRRPQPPGTPAPFRGKSADPRTMWQKGCSHSSPFDY